MSGLLAERAIRETGPQSLRDVFPLMGVHVNMTVKGVPRKLPESNNRQ